MHNTEVARLFDELADLLELQGANAFRLRAYRNASRTISSLPEPIAELAKDGVKALQSIQGIGKDLSEKLVTIVESGKLPQLEELREQIPSGVVMMLRIPGIGPKKVATIFNELGVTTLDQLREAAEQGQIAELKGFGAKTAMTILEGLDQVEQSAQRVYHADARPVVEQIVAALSELDEVTQVSVAGSFRRCRETIGDLDVLATATDSAVTTRSSKKCLHGATRNSECDSARFLTGSRSWSSICVSFPTNLTARPCSISQAQKSTISSFVNVPLSRV
jgi:DNA polymerase (family X)